MDLLNRLAFHLGHALHSRPWVRVVIGAALIAVGLLELLVGAGHGRIVAFGALLLIGSAIAARRRHSHEDRDPSTGPERRDQR